MNIATLANNLPKIKKDELLDRLVGYYNDHGLKDGDDRELQELLAFAYKQFLPSVKVTKKDDFSWVSQGVANKDDCRYYLQHIYCDGDRLAVIMPMRL